MVNHVEIEIGVGRYEAFTIMGSESVSSTQTSVAAALSWLRRHLVSFVTGSEIEVPDCTAAIYDVEAEEVLVQWHGTCDELAELLWRLAD